ncbi:ABC transporter permease [Marinicrinis lubricantis]|uniref:ABC transporter permease n=1 Tax=Marinicrinis lubricantis TaxID=2086470 RepID=A0ABW1IUE5_9BACL
MNVIDIRKKRARRFWGKIVPFVPYALGSGLLLFIGGAFIIFLLYYNRLLDNIPTDFPLTWVSVAVLLPFVLTSAIWTYLKPADVVFLLPFEGQIRAYFRTGIVRTQLVKMIAICVPWFFLWPLYRELRQIEGTTAFWVILGSLWAMQAVCTLWHWMEMQLAEKKMSILFLQFRRITAFLVLYAFFKHGVVTGWIMGAALSVLFLGGMRYVPHHQIHWERWIEKEQIYRSRAFRWLNLFVDVPYLLEDKLQVSYIGGKLSGLTRWLPFRRESLFLYFYMKKLLKGESFGILVRQWLLLCLLVIALDYSLLRVGLFAALIYIGSVQLSAFVSQMTERRYWSLYTLDRSEPIKAACTVAAWAHLILIGLSSAVCLVAEPSIWMAAAAAGSVLCSYLYFRAALPRKMMKRSA